MYFTDRERAVYRPPGADAAYDPLAISRAVTVATGGRTLADLVAAYNAGLPRPDGGGATDLPRTPEEALAAAVAEGLLVRASRAAFGLPPFPEASDATALALVFDFAGWLEGND